MHCTKIFLSVLLAFISYKVYTEKNKPKPPVPKIEETWWGPLPPAQNNTIRQFTLNIPSQTLIDLKQRLDSARAFVPPLEGIAQEYGFNTDLLRDIVDYWREKYDWRKREDLINLYPQFLVNIQGLDIHYFHLKPQQAKAGVKIRPILLLHGWPGSVLEFFQVMPILARGNDKIAFEVYVASLPGFGFSQAALRPGLGAIQVAVLFKNFMQKMGHDRYYVQGGDFGMPILRALSVMYPEKVLGFHSNMCVNFSFNTFLRYMIGLVFPRWYMPEEHHERVYPLGERFMEIAGEMGHFSLQTTKPDTLGVALNDSPVGLAAYILDKFVAGTNKTGRFHKDGLLKNYYTYDVLLDNVMWYWVTGSMPTAMRLYAESYNKAQFALNILDAQVQVPVVCARFKNDLYSITADIKDAFPNLLQLSDYDEGHFAGFQVPNKLAQDVISGVEVIERYWTERKNMLL